MNESERRDPAERHAWMRLFYRNWRPTHIGRWVNRLAAWLSAHGLLAESAVALEVRGRNSGHVHAGPVVVATVENSQYVVSILGPQSDWVKNIEAAAGDAVIRRRARRKVHLVPIPTEQRATILREYVRVASSGRLHFPLPATAPLSEFAAIAARYPVYRIDPA